MAAKARHPWGGRLSRLTDTTGFEHCLQEFFCAREWEQLRRPKKPRHYPNRVILNPPIS